MAGHPWQAATLDLVMRPLYPARRRVVPHARGHVLEIGVGTGLNFELYQDPERLVGIEPDPHMMRRARARAAALDLAVDLHEVGAEAMPFEDASFDTVVLTFTLCTIPDTTTSLREMHRVLKPGGRLLFVEHTRAGGAVAARIQDALTPVWKRLGGGCHLNRPATTMMRESGFLLDDVEPLGRATWTIFPIWRGVATRASAAPA